MKKGIVFSGMLFLLLCGQAQRKSDFAMWEDSIVRLHRSIIAEPNSALRYEKNETLLYLVEETLGLNNSISYPFDSIKTIAVVSSPDKKVRIFTWYLVDTKGTHEHFGFVQAYHPAKKRYMVYPLIDKWQRVENPSARTLPCDHWFGAVYTKLIEVKATNGTTYYTLLGWNGGNIFSQYKLIDVLTFNAQGKPMFGSQVFRKDGKNMKATRIVFHYAKKGYMHLGYEKQVYTQRSATRDKKTRQYVIEKIPSNMIVFNRLIPLQEGLKEIPQIMVGEISLNDAFIEKEGKWHFKADIIAANPDRPMPKRERTKRTYYTPVE